MGIFKPLQFLHLCLINNDNKNKEYEKNYLHRFEYHFISGM
jgi:hypothetical protein